MPSCKFGQIFHLSNVEIFVLIVKKSYLWEKKFISKISSSRGQDELLVGATAAKMDKKLTIPPLEGRLAYIRTKLQSEGALQSTMNVGTESSMEFRRKKEDVKFLSTSSSRAVNTKSTSIAELNRKGSKPHVMNVMDDQRTMSEDSQSCTLSLPVAASATNRSVSVIRKHYQAKPEATKTIPALANTRLAPLQAMKGK
jgi:hypothetical protein